MTRAFKRHEIKYLVTPEQYEILLDTLESQMNYDEYCAKDGYYRIYNLYFDTKQDDIIRHSLEKPYYKEKLRLRSYRLPVGGSDLVFLELKKKIGGVVAKRRAVISCADAARFVDRGVVPVSHTYQDGQVLKEIAGFLARYEVSPKVYISYERTAFFGKDDPDFRLSFDKQILTRRKALNFTEGDYGAELIADGSFLMEIKCADQIPLWMCHLLSELKLYKTSFSKYGTEYERYRTQAVKPQVILQPIYVGA